MKQNLVIVPAVVFVILCVVVGSANAQQGEVVIDRVGCLISPNYLVLGGNPRFEIKFVNNTGEKVDISNGFKMSSPDGALWDSVTIDTVGYDFGAPSTIRSFFDVAFALRKFYPVSPIGCPDTVGIIGVGTWSIPESQLPNGFDGPAIAITLYIGKHAREDTLRHICLDTSFFQPGGVWRWVGQSLTEYNPAFIGPANVGYTPGFGYCFEFWIPPCLATTSSASRRPEYASPDCASCAGCCRGYTGNVNMVGVVDVSDLSALVSYLTGGGYEFPCAGEADINASGAVDVSDLSCLVNYLVGGGYSLPVCRSGS